MFEDGEALTVVQKGPPGHATVVNVAGTEAIIKNSEILLDEKWSMHQAPIPTELPVKVSAMPNDIKTECHLSLSSTFRK